MTRSLPFLLTLALSVTQVIGWATAFNALAVLARPISEDLSLPLPVTLAGSSVFLVALAFTSRALVPLYPRFGAGRILTMGSVAASAGFVAIALSSGPVSYGLGWLILGAAGAAMLTAPAHALLVEALGRDAKRWIAAVMLASGLGASIGLPATLASSRCLRLARDDTGLCRGSPCPLRAPPSLGQPPRGPTRPSHNRPCPNRPCPNRPCPNGPCPNGP